MCGAGNFLGEESIYGSASGSFPPTARAAIRLSAASCNPTFKRTGKFSRQRGVDVRARKGGFEGISCLEFNFLRPRINAGPGGAGRHALMLSLRFLFPTCAGRVRLGRRTRPENYCKDDGRWPDTRVVSIVWCKQISPQPDNAGCRYASGYVIGKKGPSGMTPFHDRPKYPWRQCTSEPACATPSIA